MVAGMGHTLAERISAISASPTLAITAKAKGLKAQGLPVISFGAGEPDFDTPLLIKEAAKKAIDCGFTKYTPNTGTPELRKAICAKLKRDNGLDYTPDQIIVSSGAKQCLFNAMMAICDPGDEILVIGPYWVSYIEQIKLAGGVPVIVPTSSAMQFHPRCADVEARITGKTKAIIVNSPCNPTGAVYAKDELAALADCALTHNLYVISDEIYEKILYDGEHVSIASFNSAIKTKTIVVNGVSKSHAMTGWRIGYAAAEKNIIDAMDTIQSHDTSNANSIAQHAAIAALNAPQDSVAAMVTEFKARRDYIVRALNEISGITCTNPRGAFYVFPNVSTCFGKYVGNTPIMSSMDFCNVLLEQEHTALVPGEAFGDGACVRLSYALSMDEIVEGVKRIRHFVEKLK